MSYTIVRDFAEERRQFENRINAVLRHCRIGKVVQKPRRSMSDLLSRANAAQAEAMKKWPPFSF